MEPGEELEWLGPVRLGPDDVARHRVVGVSPTERGVER
jgi:hypothetical protein